MDLIDEQGRLFGIVNIVDALVVLFVVSVVIAGVAFVNPFAPRESAVRYATVDLGTQPDYLVERVTAGDRMELQNSPDNLTITDVYLGPAENGTQIAVRVRLAGEQTDPEIGPPQFLFGDDPVLVGQELTIETIDYTVTGSVTQVDLEGESLPTETRSVLATTNVTTAEADRLEVGDAYRVDGQSVAVIKSLQLYPSTDSEGRLALLGLELSTIQRGASTQFGPHVVRLGATVPFESATYNLRPQIVELGTAEIQTEETPVVLEATVPTTTVDDIQAGDTFDLGDGAIATLESVAVFPTTDRTQKRVVLGTTLVTRDEGDRRFFASQPVQVGETIPFSTPAYDITGTVVRAGSTEPPGEPTTTTVTLKLDNLSPELADDIQVGMTESVRGETLARIVDRNATPAVVILESEDGNIYERQHPRNLDVTLTVELQTRETTTDLRFHGEPIQIGDTIVLDLGPVTVQAQITSLD